MPNNVSYGIDSLNQVGKQAMKLGKKALIISDPMMNELGYVEKCQKYLSHSKIPYATYLGVNQEPTNIHVTEAMNMCEQENCDLIIAIGGGSCIDTAKAVAILMTNGGTLADYFGTGREFLKPSLPVIAIPTTAGTGSEVTKVTVITDLNTHVKMMISHEQLLPKIAIVDPMLTISCPQKVTAATGVDALCHAIEAFISKKAHPLTDMMALTAIDYITKNIRLAYEEGDNVEAREKMVVGSMLAGAAFSNASVTLVHGMSRPVGALFHIPHGISNAMLLPAVLEFSKEHAIDRLAIIGQKLAPHHLNVSNEALATLVVQEIKKLCLDLNIPNMKMYGIDEEKFYQSLDKMAHDAIVSGSPANNPKVPTKEEIINLYQTCFDYDFSK